MTTQARCEAVDASRPHASVGAHRDRRAATDTGERGRDSSVANTIVGLELRAQMKAIVPAICAAHLCRRTVVAADSAVVGAGTTLLRCAYTGHAGRSAPETPTLTVARVGRVSDRPPLRVLWRRGQRGWPANLPLAQLPNGPLLAALGAWVTATLTDGSLHYYARAVFYAALAAWAWDELARGANWVRRALGVAGLFYVVVKVGAALGA